MAEAQDSPLDKLRKELKKCDKTFQTCCTFYKRVIDILGDDCIDRLTLAIIQQYALGRQENAIHLQVNEKRKQLVRVWECLRIGIIGEVAAGKSSLMNYLMGDNYLPIDQGICTKVVCEVYNSDFRYVQVLFCDGTKLEKLLENNPDDKNWQWLGEIIENGYLFWDLTNEKVDVKCVQIFWPLDIFKDTELLKTHDLSGEENMYKTPSVVFVDYPGLDDSVDEDGTNPSLKFILGEIEEKMVDGFLILIDNSHHNCMKEIQKFMSHAVVQFPNSKLDADKCLFICNKWDLVSSKQHKKTELKESVLRKLQKEWATVQDSQVIQFSCVEKQNETELINAVYQLVITAKRRRLEEYWLWLTNLCEVALGLIKCRHQWCKTEETMIEVKHKALKDVEFLKKVKSELLVNGAAILDNKTDLVKRDYEAYLKERLQGYCKSMILKENSSFTHDLYEAKRDFSLNLQTFKEDIDAWFQNLQNNIVKQSWLLNLFYKTSCQSVNQFNFLLLGLVMVIPLAKVILVGALLKDEIDEARMKNPNNRIKMEVSLLSYHVEEIRNNFIMHIERQIALFNNIGKLEIQPCNEQIIDRLQRVIDGLLNVFLIDVAVHEIPPEDVLVIEELDRSRHFVHTVQCNGLGELARKKIETRIPHKLKGDEKSRAEYSKSLSTQVTYCRELILLRKLSVLTADMDYQHFVKYIGSCIEDVDGCITLYLFMEKCDGNLEDVYIEKGLGSRKMIDICIETAKGVNFLHKHGIVHRDIKPQNFLVKDGIIKICDVGHSKEEDKIVTIGSERGTKKYHPPEIMNDYSMHTPKSDIYSLGMVFCEVWKDGWTNSTGLLSSLSNTNTQQKVQKAMKKIITGCLQNDPNTRPDIQTLIKQLYSIKQMC
ncbi:uncharacterized protein LOC134698035 isoform X2 [Mytilus trossulus]|uniref:uncharacterized protein LOC134698035 isoform X2 n=1 Tax=Mytilus trossulus TaxID=6551 RepID=UPI003006EB44